MGQRHQAFIIAKIVPHGGTEPKYRCLAAFHSQWCYGTMPLFAAARLISLVKANASLVQSEVDSLHGLHGTFQIKPALPKVPAPFLGFLLGSAWSVDLGDNPQASGVSFASGCLHADMASFGGDNNDGITVVDVTDPHNPAYCFVISSRQGPSTAEEYVRSYYPLNGEDEEEINNVDGAATPEDPVGNNVDNAGADESNAAAERQRQFDALVLESIALHKDRPVIPTEHLAEAWPAEYSKRSTKTTENTAADTPNKLADKLASVEITPNISAIPPLASLTMAPALSHAVASGELEEIERIVWMPNKATEILSLMRDHSPFLDNGIPLLLKALSYRSDKYILDLSGFRLSSEQIIQVLGGIPDVRTLDLSRIEAVEASTIRAILPGNPGIRRLVLMGCPKLPESDIIDMLKTKPKLFYGLEALIHPAFLKRIADSRMSSTYPSAFSYVGLHGHGGINSTSLPVFTPSSIISALIDFLGLMLCEDMSARWSIGQSKFPIPAAFSALPRAPDVDWNSRTVWCVPQMSFGALRGEGWSFIAELGSYGMGSKYGFVRMSKWGIEEVEARRKAKAEKATAEAANAAKDAPAPAEVKPSVTKEAAIKDTDTNTSDTSPRFEIHDFPSFLVEVAKEGRPDADPKLIEKLSEIFEALGQARGGNFGPSEEPMVLFKLEDLPKFMNACTMHLQRAY